MEGKFRTRFRVGDRVTVVSPCSLRNLSGEIRLFHKIGMVDVIAVALDGLAGRFPFSENEIILESVYKSKLYRLLNESPD